MGMYDELGGIQVKCFGIPCIGFNNDEKLLRERQFYCHTMGGRLRYYKKGDKVPCTTPFYDYGPNFAIYDWNIFSEEYKNDLCVLVIQDGKFIGKYKLNSRVLKRLLKEGKISYFVDKYGYPFVCEKQSDLIDIVDEGIYTRNKNNELEDEYLNEFSNGKYTSARILFNREYMNSLSSDEVNRFLVLHNKAADKASAETFKVFRDKWFKPQQHLDDEINFGWELGSLYYILKNKNNGIRYEEFTKEGHDEIYRRLLKVLKAKGNTFDEEVMKYRQWCYAHDNNTIDWNLFDDMIDEFEKVEI